jgi:uncharacterized protein (DUF2235 family)
MTTPRNIVLFSDGTGNGAAATTKTNVWRLYRALDLGCPAPGQCRQLAFYIDGVGTSGFRPFALLGSVFGIGVARNTKEMYKFLCRNYQPGDRIFAFGFSRGAFTARVLCGLVASQGLVRYRGEDELELLVADAYRAYRRRYRLELFSPKDSSDSGPERQRVSLVEGIRDVRDRLIAGWRWLRRMDVPSGAAHKPEIAFLGVWDTVAAYGLPIDEMTRGIDRWVWPLSMPDYHLSRQVRCARHALALDEERDSFQPLLWDERREAALAAEPGRSPGRLQQVWFAGVHSNVGGGYADDALSIVPLDWMMGEAAKEGLRYAPPDRQEPRPPANPFGRRYDSRSGIAAYYRYQPRKLSARLVVPDRTTRLQQNPNRNDRGFLTRIVVHESVLERIRDGTDSYAPIGLPSEFHVLDRQGGLTRHRTPFRAARQEWVWNDVWRRRVNYFLVVILSLMLAAFPWFQSQWPPGPCLGPTCVLSPFFSGLGMVLPGLAQTWLDAFAAAPASAAGLMLVIMGLLGRSSSLERRIRDGSRELWAQSLGLPQVTGESRSEAGRRRSRPRGGIYAIRASACYQRTFQYLKWWALPGLFGLLLLVGGLALAALTFVVLWGRWDLASRERSGAVCDLTPPGIAGQAAGPVTFSTRQACWNLGQPLAKGDRYRITIAVPQAWRDRTIPTDPGGIDNARLPLSERLGASFVRRSARDRPFQPVLRITRPGRDAQLQSLTFTCACGSGQRPDGIATYTAEFVAVANGLAGLFVNEGIVAVPFVTTPGVGLTADRYADNEGEARVEITRLPPPARR